MEAPVQCQKHVGVVAMKLVLSCSHGDATLELLIRVAGWCLVCSLLCQDMSRHLLLRTFSMGVAYGGFGVDFQHGDTPPVDKLKVMNWLFLLQRSFMWPSPLSAGFIR